VRYKANSLSSFEKDLFALGRYVEWGNFKWMQSQNEEVLWLHLPFGRLRSGWHGWWL